MGRVIVNCVAWAKKHLMETGLITSVRRGLVRIAEPGRSLLGAGHERIDITLESGCSPNRRWVAQATTMW